MARLLILTSAPATDAVLPALELLSHRARILPTDTAQLVSLPDADAIIVDGRHDLVSAKAQCTLLASLSDTPPILLVVTDGGFSAVSQVWGISEVISAQAGPAETDARIRLITERANDTTEPSRVHASGITIDEHSYTAKVQGRSLDLTFKEFQLLHFLATNPGRVFTREQLLSEVWGYDYFGGTRTVDVHVRRLRAKLGDHEQIIGTVRNVGYLFHVNDDAALDES